MVRESIICFLGAAILGAAISKVEAQPTRPNGTPQNHAYLGMWITKDGHIRHELLPNGRYDEQRGERKSAYQGRYWVKENRIEYIDDTGFSADGEFTDNVFRHGGYLFYREERKR